MSDSSKCEKILKSDDGPKLIADAINGFAAKVSEHIDRLSARDKNEGLIKSRLSSITQQIEANNKKIDQVDQSITKSSEAIRKQYMSYLSSYYKAQNQAGYLSMLSSQTSSNAYDSLLQQQATSKTQKS
ncbi:hypothetical protein SDC9_194877 [bioreactor metagenome]|uniref:Flagellar hook-associated protein 2 C-terminal domain-containing protein n=1 Tax=bioreactor metagenome TaxID=1076179 RepID=A0A645I7H4_9ZZZZ